jgi:hypothetical protein
MAIIDPDGLFNGDRLRKCSKMARLYWPYFFLASNGYGRLEVNYHRIIARAFSTFGDDVPAEPEVMSYLKEYAQVHLLFLYMNGGQMWGQWDAKDNSLSKYKTSADKKSPAPPEEEFINWKKSYKAETKSFVSSLETFTKNSEKVPEVFLQISPLGVGVGEGIGEGKSKISRVAKAPRPTTDPRFAPVKDAIEQCCIRKNVPFVWGAAEGTQLSTWLKSVPNESLGRIKEMVWNRFHSKDPPGRRPCKWIADLSTWSTGPTDRFNKEPDGQGTQSRTGQVARAEERERAAIGNIAKALQNRIGEVDGSDSSAVSAFSDHRVASDAVAGGLGAVVNGVRGNNVSQGDKPVVDQGEILSTARGNQDRVRKHGADAGADDS